MASRLILKDVNAPIQFLLRIPASSVPSKATVSIVQTIQNLSVSRQNPQSNAGESSKPGFIGGRYGFGLGRQRPMDLKFALDDRFKIEARGKQRWDDDDDLGSNDEGDGGGDLSDYYHDSDKSDGDNDTDYLGLMDDDSKDIKD